VAGRDLRVILKSVHRGEAYVAPGLAYAMIKGLTRPRTDDPLQELTVREREALELVAAGTSNAEIGGRLGLAEKTVKHVRKNLLDNTARMWMMSVTRPRSVDRPNEGSRSSKPPGGVP
jgi:DNA-binding NarL/FixJ family response regulator